MHRERVKCHIEECENTFRPHGRKVYCSTQCRMLARRVQQKKFNMKTRSPLGRRLKHLLDCEDANGKTKGAMTSAEWRGQHPTMTTFVKQGEPRKL